MKIELCNRTIQFEDLASMITDRVTEIYVEGVSLLGDDDSALTLHKKIRGHPNLEEVTFVNVAAPEADGGIDVLVSMLLVSVPNLRSVRFEKTKISPMTASAVAYSSSLQRLTLSNSGFNDGDVVAVANAIAKCPSLVSVDLRGNDLSDAGCLAAASILKKSPTLASILLDGEGRTSVGPGSPTTLAMDRPTPRAA